MRLQHQPRIKICGLKDVATIQAMDGLPIDEIGFIFAPSKRQVDNQTASLLINAVHGLKTGGEERPRTVGVFVNPTEEQLDEVLKEAPLDVIQLHGNETEELCGLIRSKHPNLLVWKVFSINKASATDHERQPARELLLPYRDAVDAVLIDAPGGGTGQPFDWAAIDEYLIAAHALALQLYVAGGLNADNVQQLLQTYKVDGIDVSSGVETDGHKDIDKIKLFIRRVIEA